MHTGIRAPTANRFNLLAGNNRYGIVQNFLNSAAIGLNLPTLVIAAIVGEF
jgi:hypothetical protein